MSAEYQEQIPHAGHPRGGDGKHIALGADLDGCETLPVGFNGVQDYPKIASRLLERGLSMDMIENIFWNNALEVLKQCCI